jgi:hypothetical protein
MQTVSNQPHQTRSSRLPGGCFLAALLLIGLLAIVAYGYNLWPLEPNYVAVPSYPSAANLERRLSCDAEPSDLDNCVPRFAYLTVTFTTQDSPSTVLDFYRRALISEGWRCFICPPEVSGRLHLARNYGFDPTSHEMFVETEQKGGATYVTISRIYTPKH